CADRDRQWAEIRSGMQKRPSCATASLGTQALMKFATSRQGYISKFAIRILRQFRERLRELQEDGKTEGSESG
ncbi:MAG TPA: hypothetical protein VNO21_08855, partial [Polyangiaceae bacterium]|nr:hypothetical protein [Polyangiaceae bacterium]